MSIQDIKDALSTFDEADKNLREALYAKREADYHLKDCLLRDGRVDCLSINIARVRRMFYHVER